MEITALTGIEALRWAAEQGARFCKVAAWNATGPHPGKRALGEGWQENALTTDQVELHVKGGGNVGVLTGTHSGGICMFDADEQFPEFADYFPHLAGGPKLIRDNDPQRGKTLFRVVGGSIPSRGWKKPGERHPFFELLSDGRQGVIVGTHPSGVAYRLVIGDRPLPELTPQMVSDICATWTGEGLEENEPPAPTSDYKPAPSHPANGDGLRESVLAAWPTIEIFRRFGRVQETRIESRGKWLRLKGNGGLFVTLEGGKPGTGWFSHSENFGGGPFEAWAYCKTGRGDVPKNGKFYELLKEMAAAANIPIPERRNGNINSPGPEIPPFDELEPREPAAAQVRKPATFADLQSQLGPIDYCWRPWLPNGLLTIIGAETGVGKSNLMLHLCRSFLLGEPWPDGTPFAGETGAVLWCEAEAAQALNLERAVKWGYPLEKIYFPTENPMDDFVFDNPKHRTALREKAMLPEVRFIVYDSLSGSTGRSEKDSEIKGISQFLAMVARDSKKPVILSHHLRKKNIFDTNVVTLDRLRGYSGILQYARVIWALDVPDTDHPEKKRLAMIKNNLARLADPMGMIITDTGIAFGEAPTIPQTETQLTRAIDLLRALLARGPERATRIEDEFGGAGISPKTMRRAKEELSVLSFRQGEGWYWTLPVRENTQNDGPSWAS